jgi:hypothetical protein
LTSPPPGTKKELVSEGAREILFQAKSGARNRNLSLFKDWLCVSSRNKENEICYSIDLKTNEMA